MIYVPKKVMNVCFSIQFNIVIRLIWISYCTKPRPGNSYCQFPALYAWSLGDYHGLLTKLPLFIIRLSSGLSSGYHQVTVTERATSSLVIFHNIYTQIYLLRDAKKQMTRSINILSYLVMQVMQ